MRFFCLWIFKCISFEFLYIPYIDLSFTYNPFYLNTEKPNLKSLAGHSLAAFESSHREERSHAGTGLREIPITGS